MKIFDMRGFGGGRQIAGYRVNRKKARKIYERKRLLYSIVLRPNQLYRFKKS